MMSYNEVTAAYAGVNTLLALLILARSPSKPLSRFFTFCVLCLVLMSVSGMVLSQPLQGPAREVIEDAIVFFYSLVPSFFLHFLVIFARREEILKSKTTLTAIYLAGFFSYALLLLGLIPKPVEPAGGISSAGYLFCVTWMSIFLSIGVAMLYSSVRKFSERQMRSNLFFSGFTLLLLVLPGPFTETLNSLLFRGSPVSYFYSSTVALIASVYLVFRHRIIVNTPYDILKTVLTGMNDLLIKTDEELRIQMMGGPVSALLGYTETELKDHPLLKFMTAGGSLVQFRERAIRGGAREGSFEGELVRKNGEKVAMSFSFSAVPASGEITGFLGVARDISRQKRAEERIRVLAHAVESTTELISITDLEDRIVFVNSAFLTSHRYGKEEVLGRSASMFRSSAGQAAGGGSILTQTLAGGWLGEVTNRRKDGTEFPAVLSTSRIRNDDGQVIGLIGVAHDISDRKQAIDALVEAEARFRSMFEGGTAAPNGKAALTRKADSTLIMNHLAERISAVIENMRVTSQRILSFSSLAAHELRTPLAIMRQELEQALNLSTPEKSLRMLIVSTYDEILRLSRTVETMLGLGALQSGTFELNLKRVDLQKLLKEFCDDAVQLSRQKQMSVTLSPGPAIYLDCDPDRIRQVLFNLFDNALKHSPGEGSIHLGCTVAPEGVILTFADTGEGISPEELPRIFDPFYRGTGKRAGGAGLGLAFVQWIIEAHRGSISAESALGKGTTFKIVIPPSKV